MKYGPVWLQNGMIVLVAAIGVAGIVALLALAGGYLAHYMWRLIEIGWSFA